MAGVDPGVDISRGPTMVWVGQSVLLKDFKNNYSTPNIVKVVQGEYMNIGANISGGEHKESEILLHSIQNTSKILALNMRLTEGRRVEQTSQKLSIPMTYEGWFEVLSEDGRVIRAIECIKDLARIFPHTCLVREDIKAYLSKENGEICMDRCRIVQAGERLTLFGIISATHQGSKEVRFLRCLDLRGASAYFTFDQKGLFSPVAGKGNISGVHTIKGILNKFHLPLTIRLVFGTYPKQMPKGRFCGIIRLLYVYQDETAFVCPAKGDYRMLPISTEEPLKVMPAMNFDDLKDEKCIKGVWERCSKMARSYLNTIHVLYDVTVPEPTNRNLSNPYVTLNEGTEKLWEQNSANELPKEEEDQLMDEVEDIYLYVVRHGVSPPPMKTRQTSTDPGDKDYWEEPVYNTLHRKKQKDRDSLVDIVKRMEAKDPNPGRNKVFRFHHQPGEKAHGRRLSFVRTNQQDVDKVVAIDGDKEEENNDVPPPVPPKLFEKSQSLENLAADNVEEVEARKIISAQRDARRRKSQPAMPVLRIFNKKSDRKTISGDGSGSGSGKGSNSTAEDEAKLRKSKMALKLKQMYV
jgi:hypothetical protein